MKMIKRTIPIVSVPRVQFLAIEIARNRDGINSQYQDTFKKYKEESNEQLS